MADPFDAVNAEEMIGKVIDGRYRVDDVLGYGGMGMVFRGVQTSMQRPIALKTLHPQFAAAPAFFERFRREAEIASRLKHPNIITIYDFGKAADGLCYFVMELLEGESLRQRVKRTGPLTLREAVAVIEQAALGVGHAHKQQVIHRDIKPHNIMVTEVDGAEYVKVLDFGLVKALEQEDEEQLTSTGQVLGTPQYMPPEQAGGEDVDQRSDIYALTAVFYYCLTGTSPFGANTVRKALTAALTQKVPPVMTHRVGAPVPEAVDRFLAKGLKPEKDDRFQDMDEFIAAMKASIEKASDAVLDAVPTYTPEGAAEGHGSGSNSKKSNSRPAPKVASAATRALPKSAGGGSSRVELAPSLAESVVKGGGNGGIVVGLVVLAVVAVGGGIAWKLLGTPAEQPEKRTKPPVALVETETKPPAATPAIVKVTITTTPANAEVLEDGVTIGNTPLAIDWTKGTKRTLTFRAEGFKEMAKSLRPEGDQALDFALEVLPQRPTLAPVKKNPKTKPEDIGAFE